MAVIVEALDRRVLDGAVHALHLTVSQKTILRIVF
jgi:hypothetical protein